MTGGPGAGKTALLEMVRRNFCEHVAVLPEAASVLFGGGFPRRSTVVARCAAQRAIFHVQVEMERLEQGERSAAVALCDRGTLDGLAYWPGDVADYWREIGSTQAAELARYAAVVHLRTPPPSGYNHENPLRVESATEAAAIDARIATAWQGHLRVTVVDHTTRFLDKVARALAAIQEEVPPCCRTHQLPELAP